MATETTLTSAKAWSPDITAFAASEVIPDALVLQTSTVTGRIEGDEPAVRVAYVDDAAAQFVAEGTEIPEDDPALSEVLVHTGKVAQLVRLSREQYSQTGTAQMLSESVRRAVIKKANEAYIAQAAPVAPAVTPPAGLLNVTGIEAGGAVAGDLDALVDLIATLEGNGATPTHILLAPDAWASLRKFKTATGSAQTLLGAGTTDATKSLLDLPVLVSSAMTAGTGLVIDKSAVVSAVGEVQLAVSDQVYFNSDSIGLRCTFRFGANLVRPDRVGTFTVTNPA
ncbi:phage major capsid protein [Rhodococcus sp. AH-ZY2]|uniref:phage major capsid protein n=1 Tax=Rhodococcus sp. AH-ZY2 TaxID=3047468 RepID=UPI0027DF03E9|nr:phage major capsid protein [Rhodococcus sp. AH-ZY2]WML63206.1 phage major capsid protein [Rhodococcus sp. AH-ZY2]WML64272.1 phage major capsid protein [Rhodococcus sp. AH-ZY2]